MGLMRNVEDLRVRRTRKLLHQALLELAIEKGFRDLTVRDITERAMINRSTFYRHYLDKHDLLRECIAEVYARVPAPNESSLLDTPKQHADEAPAWLVSILKHVHEHADFYRGLLGTKGDPVFCAQSFRHYIEMRFRAMLSEEPIQTDPRRPPIGLSVSYVSHAAIGAIVWWLDNDQAYPPEQFAVWLSQFSTADIGLSLGPGRKAADSHEQD
jgi:AcrR family transcriptional regulator